MRSGSGKRLHTLFSYRELSRGRSKRKMLKSTSLKPSSLQVRDDRLHLAVFSALPPKRLFIAACLSCISSASLRLQAKRGTGKPIYRPMMRFGHNDDRDAYWSLPRMSSSRNKWNSSAPSLTSEPPYSGSSTLSPTALCTGIRVPSMVRAPGPTATTSPSFCFWLSASGR